MVESIVPAWLTSLFDSFGPEAVGGSEAVMSGGAAPVQASIGQQAGQAIGQMVSPQIQPYQNFYNTVTNPNTSVGDMARSGFQLAFNPNEDEKNLNFKQMPNPYGGMANNYVGGIPSLLQNTGSGILPYIGSR
jgi:hypothetical protein